MQVRADEPIDREEYVAQIMTNLRRQYAERAPLPTRSDGEGEPMTLYLLQRLFRHVMVEGYGE